MLVPDNVEKFESHGERILFHKFKNDVNAQDYIVLHSLFTNYHLNNVSGELDFLVLAPGKGFFAIEVKHGGVKRENGVWYFTNRKGETTKNSKGPFSQVEGTKHSIRNYIIDSVSEKDDLLGRLSQVLFATGVAFTSLEGHQINFGPEGFSWQILTQGGLKLPISKYIEVLSNNWHNQYCNHYWYDVHNSRPSKKDCEKVLKIIRGDFKIDYSEVNRISDNEKQIEQFTEEQFQILDFADFNDRCLIQGQAGTGKTVLALELANRRVNESNKVGLFCFNNQLGEKLEASLESMGERGSENYAGTLHKYLYDNISDVSKGYSDDSIYFKEKLPIEFLIQNEDLDESDKFDILIVDEAQDLLTDYYIEVFDWILKGGIREGKWVMFGDFSNQAIYLNDPDRAKELLNRRSFFTTLPPLRINCRNTKKIASHNSLLTGAKLPEFTGKTLAGKPINAKFPAKSKQGENIIEIVQNLLDRGVKRDQITLLAPKKFENTFLADSDYIRNQKMKGMKVTTIHSYKGLENVVIVLFGFSEIDSKEARRLLYVGISRATQELYLVLNKDLEASYNSLVAENYLGKS